jgi:hypothetical protein
MHKRLLLSVFAALALAGSVHVSVAAAPPLYLICQLPNESAIPQIHILVDNFGGMSDAVHHCLTFWHGHPSGVAR